MASSDFFKKTHDKTRISHDIYNFENVGDNFSKKVREIYYDKKNNKTIYGTTTQKEREELSDEGIDLLSIPWVDKEN